MAIQRRTLRKQKAALKALRLVGGNIKEASKIAQVNRCTIHDWLKNSVQFQEQFDIVLDELEPKALEYLEDELVLFKNVRAAEAILKYKHQRSDKRSG